MCYRQKTSRNNLFRNILFSSLNIPISLTEQLKSAINSYYAKSAQIEEKKYDYEKEIMVKDYEINELNIQVNDLRGKFIKPTLKKVSKYENKFAKLQKKAAEFNFRNQLKTVKKKEFELEEDKSKEGKPDWAAGGHGATKKEGEEGETVEEEAKEEVPTEVVSSEGGNADPVADEGAPAESTPEESSQPAPDDENVPNPTDEVAPENAPSEVSGDAVATPEIASTEVPASA